MKQRRERGTRKASEFDDSRVRPAIKNPGHRCIEMHCARSDTHSYSEKGCSWVELENGEIISRTEAIETTTRPDRVRKDGALDAMNSQFLH
jgi:hypothetical protein